MFLERRTVSRKTPGDGRLEINKQTASRLEKLGTALAIDLAGDVVPATLGTMECTCRGADQPHLHYFLQAEQFKLLTAGADLILELVEGSKRLRIREAGLRAEPD